MLTYQGFVLRIGTQDVVLGSTYRDFNFDIYVIQMVSGERITVNYQNGERIYSCGFVERNGPAGIADPDTVLMIHGSHGPRD